VEEGMEFNEFSPETSTELHAARTTNDPQTMKKLLLMAVVISGLALVPAQRSDAQVFVRSGVEGLSFGFPGGYYAYPRYLNYYPYGYYLRPYVNYSQSYYYGPAHTR
jgi:hypothetical protein